MHALSIMVSYLIWKISDFPLNILAVQSCIKLHDAAHIFFGLILYVPVNNYGNVSRSVHLTILFPLQA